MSYNRSPLAFDDIREAFDRALAAPKGIKISCEDRGAAVILRSRFNYYRKMNRLDNAKIYPGDHPMYNHSVYDRLVLRIPQAEPVLYIEPRSVTDLTIEDIT